MSEAKLKILIVVLHYMKDDVTKRCVESWFDEAMGLDAEVDVVIVDANSPEPLKWRKKGVKIKHLKSDHHLIDAFNSANVDGYDIYINITNDTWKVPQAPLLAGLVKVLQDKKVGIVAPGTNDRGSGTLTVNRPLGKADHHTKHVDNTIWAWRSDVVEAVGWPSCEGHTHWSNWYSNKEFCHRVRKAGYVVMAATGSAYFEHAHHGGQDRQAHLEGESWLHARLGSEFGEAW